MSKTFCTFPSKGLNSLTWRCKLFGCRNKKLPGLFMEAVEKHGVISVFPSSFYVYGRHPINYFTVGTVIECVEFYGCRWCWNYKEKVNIKDDSFPPGAPRRECNCSICEEAKETSLDF